MLTPDNFIKRLSVFDQNYVKYSNFVQFTCQQVQE